MNKLSNKRMKKLVNSSEITAKILEDKIDNILEKLEKLSENINKINDKLEINV